MNEIGKQRFPCSVKYTYTNINIFSPTSIFVCILPDIISVNIYNGILFSMYRLPWGKEMQSVYDLQSLAEATWMNFPAYSSIKQSAE